MPSPKELFFKSDLEDIDANPSPDRWFTLLALILAGVASVMGILVFRSAPAVQGPWQALVRDVCIFFTMLILVLIFYGRYGIVLGAKLQMKNSLEQQLKAFRDLIGQQTHPRMGDSR